VAANEGFFNTLASLDTFAIEPIYRAALSSFSPDEFVPLAQQTGSIGLTGQ
jgi:hypothetical protein